MNAFARMLRSQSGVSAAEYAMILAVIGSVIVFGALSLSNAIAGSLDRTTTQLENCRNGNC